MLATRSILFALLNAALVGASSKSWSDQCSALTISANTSSNPIHYPSYYDGSCAGISYATCNHICGEIGPVFSFSDFSSSATNWLLPWLALAAQLPYETSGPFNNVMSMLLAVGSPALITYGLTITLLARFRIATQFYTLRKRSKRSPLGSWFTERLRAAEFLLLESQQSPMRAFNRDGCLSSLIVLHQNFEWWEQTKDHLRDTRRGVTASLVVQILFAVISWLLTVIAAFSDLGNTQTGLSISTSSIWFWMIPVIIG